MKHKFLFTILFILFVLSTCQFNYAQQINTISTRCPSPNQRSYSSVRALVNGNIEYIPCPSMSSIFYGNVDFSGATITGIIDGSGTTNFFPIFTASETIGNSPYQWSGTRYFWNNTALNSAVTFEFTPSATGNLQFGDYTATPTSYFTQDYNTNISVLRSTANFDVNLTTDNISARFDNSLGTFNVRNAANTSNFEFDGNGETITVNTPNGFTVNAVTAGGVAFDTGVNQFQAGDLNSASNDTVFRIDVNNEDITFNSSGNLDTFNAYSNDVRLGDMDVIGNGSKITLDNATKTFQVTATNGLTNANIYSNNVVIGEGGAANGTNITIADAANIFTFNNGAAAGLIDFTDIASFGLQRTITPAATTGNQTINKPNGSVNIAAGGTTVTVTNSIVNANSLIIAVANTNDATCSVKNVVAGVGSLVINMDAACTGETRVAFWVTG